MNFFRHLFFTTLLFSLNACADTPASKSIVLGELQLGDQIGKVRVMAKSANRGCELSVVSKTNTEIQSIKLKTNCPDPQSFKRFDANGDGYDDFVTITGYGAGPFPDISAWLYSPTKKIFEVDESYPGGWPTSSNCVVVQSRISVASDKSPYTYTNTKHCYVNGGWQEARYEMYWDNRGQTTINFTGTEQTKMGSVPIYSSTSTAVKYFVHRRPKAH